MSNATPIDLQPELKGPAPPTTRKPRHRRQRRLLTVVGVLLLLAAGFALAHFWSPHANLRVTTGPQGGALQRFMAAFVSVSAIQHPRVHLELVQVPDLAAGAKTLEDGRTDLAIVRSDAAAPSNAQTIVILRRDVVTLVLPPHSKISSVAGLAGKTVGIVAGPVQVNNAQALDALLSFFNIPAKDVHRVFLPVAELGQAVQEKRIEAALAVGPMAPGEVVDVVAALARATKGTPGILAIDDAEAIGKRFPGFESIDVPVGAFRARPATPSDTVSTLAVTYRLAASELMTNVVAAAIARSILTTKTKLMAATPLANQIEAPDPDDKSPILPVHPGVAAYLSGGDQSFLDQFQQYFYVIGIGTSIMGSVFALVSSYWSRRRCDEDWRPIRRLVEIADEAPGAERLALEALERETQTIASSVLGRQPGVVGAERLSAFSTALSHARHALDSRKAALGPQIGPSSGPKPSPTLVAVQ
ncbi:C4-dicarboxylate ABC transporter substrate-binding protein [Methylobacterium sp. P1-11]|nr:C4-dicarboxylate ABC transporter substrate-binding protein [Methylobacterium sp. P1-11]